MQTEIQIDKHHALCQASGQLEELDYTKLHFAYSGIRKSQIEPRVLFKVLVCFQYFDRLTLVFHIFVPREQEKGCCTGFYTLQKVREVVNDSYSYSSDYEVIGKLKQFADRYGVCVLIVHHTRKQPAGDSFEMISGTTGLLGCADGALLMQKEKRTNSKATLEVVGRDQPDQRLYLSKDQESLVWVLDHAENELWKQPPDPVLEAVAKIVSADNREWEGSPTELAQAIQTDMAVNRLTKHLNVNASRLLEEHQVRYENKTKHAGRRIRLTYMMVEAPAFEVIE